MNKTDFWDSRYSSEEYIYGNKPNEFLREQLSKLTPGSILFAAEGEGRNAVYAASESWEVSAFDLSSKGKEKAEQLAKEREVSIDYKVCELENIDYILESFDVLALIYAHFDIKVRRNYHRKLASLIKSGGYLVMEAFSINHVEYQKQSPKVGGPSNIDYLYELEEIKAEFSDFNFIILEEVETQLSEGEHHLGLAKVIRILAKKI